MVAHRNRTKRFDMVNGILTIAHRGGAQLRPENTLAAISHAVALGIDGIEIDVLLSADGHVVVHHDFRLNQSITRLAGAWLTTPGPLVRDLAYEELARLDVGRPQPGSDYDASHPDLVPSDGEKIPLLRHVIAFLQSQDRPVQLMIELKLEPLGQHIEANPIELASAVAKLLEDLRFVSQSIVMSFEWQALAQLRAALPSLRLGYLTYPSYLLSDDPLPDHAPASASANREKLLARVDGETIWARGFDPRRQEISISQVIASLGGAFWCPFFKDATPNAIRAAHEQGLLVSVWNVNVVKDLMDMIELGVDGIATDRPDLLLDLLAR